MNKLAILTIPSEYRSVKKLGFDTYLRTDSINFSEKKIFIRWGNSYSILGNEYEKVYNKASSISLNCDKLNSKKILQSIVKIPNLFEKEVPANILSVIRPIEHTGGFSFNIVKGPYKIQAGYYGTEFLQTDLEYRVWFAKN